MERVLVTGGGGYIGCILVPLLVENGYCVRVVDRYFFGGNLLPSSPFIENIRSDIREMKPEHFVDVDYVIDLAAISNDPSGELFQEATYQINESARVRVASMAKASGVKRYILPSSCSIYGFFEDSVVADEDSPTNPLTTYARANLGAEKGVLPLADADFCVVVLRQATVYGYSPRMRFDLAVNGMTFGGWKHGVIPLMRDGSQWRPMVHVKDTTRAMCMMLSVQVEKVNGQIFNVGSESNVYKLSDLAEVVANSIKRKVTVDWYGDPDHRSYRVAFDKIEGLGFSTKYTVDDAVVEICDELEAENLDKTDKTITLQWYKNLIEWQQIVKDTEIDGDMIDLSER